MVPKHGTTTPSAKCCSHAFSFLSVLSFKRFTTLHDIWTHDSRFARPTDKIRQAWSDHFRCCISEGGCGFLQPPRPHLGVQKGVNSWWTCPKMHLHRCTETSSVGRMALQRNKANVVFAYIPRTYEMNKRFMEILLYRVNGVNQRLLERRVFDWRHEYDAKAQLEGSVLTDRIGSLHGPNCTCCARENHWKGLL